MRYCLEKKIRLNDGLRYLTNEKFSPSDKKFTKTFGKLQNVLNYYERNFINLILKFEILKSLKIKSNYTMNILFSDEMFANMLCQCFHIIFHDILMKFIFVDSADGRYFLHRSSAARRHRHSLCASFRRAQQKKSGNRKKKSGIELPLSSS